MKKILAASVIAVAISFMMTAKSSAQLTGNAPWCVTIYTSSNQINRCEYASFEQCQALNDGKNNTCFANPYVQAAPLSQQRRR